MIHKSVYALRHVVAKEDTRPILGCIRVQGRKATATNSYMIVEIELSETAYEKPSGYPPEPKTGYPDLPELGLTPLQEYPPIFVTPRALKRFVMTGDREQPCLCAVAKVDTEEKGGRAVLYAVNELEHIQQVQVVHWADTWPNTDLIFADADPSIRQRATTETVLERLREGRKAGIAFGSGLFAAMLKVCNELLPGSYRDGILFYPDVDRPESPMYFESMGLVGVADVKIRGVLLPIRLD